MLKELKNDDRGVVFVTVLVIIIVAAILAISALSLNVSQVKNTENELKYLQAEILAEGGLYHILTNQFFNSSSNNVSFPQTVGNTTFTITSNIIPGGPNPPGSNSVPLNVNVTF